MCVLCQEEAVTSPTGPGPDSDALVVACYVGKTTVLSQSKLPGSQCSQSFPESGMRCVPTVTSCGHAMHSKCFQKFYDSLLEAGLIFGRLGTAPLQCHETSGIFTGTKHPFANGERRNEKFVMKEKDFLGDCS